MHTPQQILTNVSHPLVTGMYTKRDYDGTNKAQEVLVIETNMEETEFYARDDRLIDLLTDLNELRMMAEDKIGHIDRIDIRPSH